MIATRILAPNNCVFATLIGASLAASSAARAAEPVGQVVQAEGPSYAAGGGARRSLARGAEVAVRDTVSTAGTGRIVVRFVDDAALSLGANAAATIESFAPAGASAPAVIRASKGTLRFAAGRGGPDAYRLETGAATIGVRGAQFDLRVEPASVRVSVASGSVILCPQRGRPAFADCVEAAAGQTITATSARAKVAATDSLPPLRANLLPLTAVAGTPGVGVPAPAAQAVGGAIKAVSGVAGAVNSVTTKVLGATGKAGGAVLNGTVGEVARPLSGTDPDEPAISRPRNE